MRIAKTLSERMKSKIWRRQPNVCWPWLGHIDKDGYGRIWKNESEGSITVQRAIMLMEHGGNIPEGMEALSCPILKDCCNPAHIGLGTSADLGDRILWKKRQQRKTQRTIEITNEIIRQIYLSTEPTSVLAQRYSLSSGSIANIRAGRRYRSVTEALDKGNSDED